jgi:hypothetical protein
MGRQKSLAIAVMQRNRTSPFAAATLALLVMTVLLVFATPALSQRKARPAPVASSTTAPAAPARNDLDELHQAKLDAAIAEAKAEVIGANNSTMGVLVTAITGASAVFTTLLLGGFAFATYRQAASAAAAAAQKEIRDARTEIDTLLTTARSAVEAIKGNAQTAFELTAGLEVRVNSPPTANPEPLPPSEKTELANAVAAAEATPRAQRTAQQFRQLMFAAEQAGDWRAYREQAEGMAFLFVDSPDDLAFALFGRAFASQQLGDLVAAANGYADYLERCPNDATDYLAGAYSNWGAALSGQAKTTSGPDADALFVQACEKTAEAVRIRPDMPGAFNNWGTALCDQAKTKTGADADGLFAQAGEKYAEADAILPGWASYNRACLAALRNDPQQAAQLLRIAKATAVNYPDCPHILQDSDFDSVRDDPIFQAALADIGCISRS